MHCAAEACASQAVGRIAGGPGRHSTASSRHRVLTGSTQQIVDDIGRFREQGVRHLVLGFTRPNRAEVIERMEAFMTEIASKA